MLRDLALRPRELQALIRCEEGRSVCGLEDIWFSGEGMGLGLRLEESKGLHPATVSSPCL
jgi:hypothetical protein